MHGLSWTEVANHQGRWLTQGLRCSSWVDLVWSRWAGPLREDGKDPGNGASCLCPSSTQGLRYKMWLVTAKVY